MFFSPPSSSIMHINGTWLLLSYSSGHILIKRGLAFRHWQCHLRWWWWFGMTIMVEICMIRLVQINKGNRDGKRTKIVRCQGYLYQSIWYPQRSRHHIRDDNIYRGGYVWKIDRWKGRVQISHRKSPICVLEIVGVILNIIFSIKGIVNYSISIMIKANH